MSSVQWSSLRDHDPCCFERSVHMKWNQRFSENILQGGFHKREDKSPWDPTVCLNRWITIRFRWGNYCLGHKEARKSRWSLASERKNLLLGHWAESPAEKVAWIGSPKRPSEWDAYIGRVQARWASSRRGVWRTRDSESCKTKPSSTIRRQPGIYKRIGE